MKSMPCIIEHTGPIRKSPQRRQPGFTPSKTPLAVLSCLMLSYALPAASMEEVGYEDACIVKNYGALGKVVACEVDANRYISSFSLQEAWHTMLGPYPPLYDSNLVIVTAAGGKGSGRASQGYPVAGGRGFARTVKTYGELSEPLHLYIGKDADSDTHRGGSSTMVLTTSHHAAYEDHVVALAGGGGGVGHRYWKNGAGCGGGNGGHGGRIDGVSSWEQSFGHGANGTDGDRSYGDCSHTGAYGRGGGHGVAPGEGGTHSGTGLNKDGRPGIGGHGGGGSDISNNPTLTKWFGTETYSHYGNGASTNGGGGGYGGGAAGSFGSGGGGGGSLISPPVRDLSAFVNDMPPVGGWLETGMPRVHIMMLTRNPTYYANEEAGVPDSTETDPEDAT